MSAKYFCDVCEAEMDPDSDMKRIKRKLGNVEIEIMTAYRGCWNGGHICPSCVLKAVNDGEPSAGMTE
jgi:hypothetical protein